MPPTLSARARLIISLSLLLVPPSPAAAEPAPAPGEGSLRVGVGTETAAGVVGGGFANQLFSGRLDWRFSPAVTLGASLGYANLKGKTGRAHAVLPLAQLEYRALLRPDRPASVPLRFGTGYLLGNGPVARGSLGLAYRLTPGMEIVVDLLAPMVWVTHDQPVMSLNLGLELLLHPRPSRR